MATQADKARQGIFSSGLGDGHDRQAVAGTACLGVLGSCGMHACMLLLTGPAQDSQCVCAAEDGIWHACAGRGSRLVQQQAHRRDKYIHPCTQFIHHIITVHSSTHARVPLIHPTDARPSVSGMRIMVSLRRSRGAVHQTQPGLPARPGRVQSPDGPSAGRYASEPACLPCVAPATDIRGHH